MLYFGANTVQRVLAYHHLRFVFGFPPLAPPCVLAGWRHCVLRDFLTRFAASESLDETHARTEQYVFAERVAE